MIQLQHVMQLILMRKEQRFDQLLQILDNAGYCL